MAKKSLFLLLFFIPFLAILVFASWPSTFGRFGIPNPVSRDYILTSADIDLKLSSDNTLQVTEEIEYRFKGCYHEVFRVPDAEIIDYTKVKASCDPSCDVSYQNGEVIGNFGTICEDSAVFNLDYDVFESAARGKDVDVLHYKVWGSEWDRTLQRIKADIVLPAEPLAVYINPLNGADYTIKGNTLILEAERVSGYLEVRILLPKVLSEGRETDISRADIEKEQNNYAIKYWVFLIITLLYCSAIAVLLSLFPIWVYRKYGKEPKIVYNAIYEREPVRGIKPYVANSLTAYRTGDTDPNAIIATLLDLARRKHVIMEEVTKKGFFKDKKDLKLKFVSNPKDKLDAPETAVVTFFKGFAENDELVWSDFLVRLKSSPTSYMILLKEFDKRVDGSYDLKRYFDSAGNMLVTKVYIGMAILAFIVMISIQKLGYGNYGFLVWTSIFSVIAFFGTAVMLGLSSRVFGRFTPEGLETVRKLDNFKKFLQDLTLLKQYPPSSLIIWEEMLVYATLFGVADKVKKNMNIVVGDKFSKSSSFGAVYSTGMISGMAGSMSSAAVSKSSGGGVGGGGGGGGGGAR